MNVQNKDNKAQVLLQEIKKAVSLRIELLETIARIKELHFCTFDPEEWIENMSLCVESGDDLTLSDVEDFCS